MTKAVLIYPLGDLSRYDRKIYYYKSEVFSSKLPVLKIAELLGDVSEIIFIITQRSKEDYYSLFEGLCKHLFDDEIKNIFPEDTLKRFRKRTDFSEDKNLFAKGLISKFKSNVNFDFLILNESNLIGFVKELKLYLMNRSDYTIHIDITHAYRFIPMFIVIVLSLLKNSGINVQIGEILYSFGEDDKNNIVSLTDYVDVLDLSHRIYTFKSSANIKPLAEGVSKLSPEISDLMSTLQESLDMNLSPKIKATLSELKTKLENIHVKHEVFNEIVREEFKRMLSDFTLDKKQSDFEVSLAKWHLKNERYLHGFTALVESIITKLAEVYEYSNVNKRDARQEVRCICLSIKDNNLKKSPEYAEFIKNKIQANQELKELQKKLGILFDDISEIRNTLAHIKTIEDKDAQRIYDKIIKFAKSLNFLELNKNLNWQSVEELLSDIERLPTMFTTDDLQKLSELCKLL